MELKFIDKLKIPDKYEARLELAFKILFVIIGFMQSCNITFGKKIISVFLWPTVVLGVFIVAYRMIHIKNYYKSKGLILLVLFTLSFFISSILFIKYGIYENIRIMMFLIYQFGILYAYDLGKNESYYRKQLKIVSCVYLIIMALLVVISFGELFCGYSAFIVNETGGPDLVFGFTWDRLFGAFWDPNIASVLACIAVLISINFFRTTDKKTCKILYALNIILQSCYILFSDSRTGKLCLLAGSITMIIIYGILKLKGNKKRAITVMLIIFMIGISTFCMKSIYNLAVELTKVTEEEQSSIVSREEDKKGDISNRRFSIWKSAFEIYKENPIFGVSRKNIINYAKDNMPNTYIVNNDHMDFDSMHDLFFDVLVSQGIVRSSIILWIWNISNSCFH